MSLLTNDLLSKAKSPDFSLPVGDVLGLHFDQFHPRIFWLSCMNSVPEVAYIKVNGGSIESAARTPHRTTPKSPYSRSP